MLLHRYRQLHDLPRLYVGACADDKIGILLEEILGNAHVDILSISKDTSVFVAIISATSQNGHLSAKRITAIHKRCLCVWPYAFVPVSGICIYLLFHIITEGCILVIATSFFLLHIVIPHTVGIIDAHSRRIEQRIQSSFFLLIIVLDDPECLG